MFFRLFLGLSCLSTFACTSAELASAPPGVEPGAFAAVVDRDAGDASPPPSSDAGRGDGADGAPADAHPASDASGDAPVDAPFDSGKAAACTGAFGAAITGVFGRLDGTVLAVIPPSDGACPLPNRDHVTLDVVMGGSAYRILVNVNSTIATVDPRVQMLEMDGPLLGGAWADGWHTAPTLDYAIDLGVHSASFAPYALDVLSARISDAIPLGAKISVFASGFAPVGDGAHKVHRNGIGSDGALVVGPDSASPHWMLFHFDTQTF